MSSVHEPMDACGYKAQGFHALLNLGEPKYTTEQIGAKVARHPPPSPRVPGQRFRFGGGKGRRSVLF